MKYRKKPVEVEAILWDGSNETINKIVLLDPEKIELGANDKMQVTTIYIRTLEGLMSAFLGDWIIKGVNGEFYPCKPDIFEKTYEPVE